ncbi:MAG: carbohydrate kinase family protein [Acidobacteriota bacterium]
MSKRILAIGDINVDIMLGGLASLPQVDREITCQSFEITMGSSAAIFAVAYACLGGTISFLGLAGKDAYGDFMLEGLERFGIGTELVRRTDRVKTGVTVNLIYQNTRSQVTYPGTIEEFSGSDIDEQVFRGFDHVHFAGPYQQTRFRPEITRCLRLAKDLRITSSLDPQWDATGRWEYMDEWLPLLTYLFVNEDEAKSIAGVSDVREACAWLAARTRHPLVKAGAAGVYLVEAETVVQVPGIPVEVVDTTGAGDTFDAAFLFQRLEGAKELTEAARFANAAAARSCRFVGGVGARSSYADVLAFQAEPRA